MAAAKGKTKKNSKGSGSKKTRTSASEENSRIVRIILGVVFAILAIYSLVVMISYCNTWHKDQSLASNPSMYDASQVVHDAGGKLGFKWASFFISEAFGLGAFVLPFLFGALSAFCFKIRRVNLVRISLLSVFGAIIFSVLLGFVSQLCHADAFLGNGAGGAYGHYASSWLCNMTGVMGAGCIIFLALLLWGIFLNRKVAYWFDDLVFFTSSIPDRVLAAEAERRNRKAAQEPVSDENSEDEPETEPDADADADTDTVIEPEPEPIPVPEPEPAANTFDDYEEEDVIDSSENDVEPIPAAVMPEPAQPATPAPGGILAPEDVELTVDESENDFLSNLSEDEKSRIYDPRLDLPKYKLPSTSILEDYSDKWYEVSRDELEKNKQRIVNALANYKIGVVGITAKMGPTVTLYKIHLAEGIKIAQVRKLEEDIAISLGAKGVRVVTLLDSVGIEVPNEKASVVALKAVLNSPQFKEKKSKLQLPLALGITVTNEPYFLDLAKMPRLLVAGATGQGKSVGLNCILASLLFSKHPAEMKLVLVDPKKVELSLYNKIDKHFLAMLPDGDEAILTETKKVVYTLKSLCIEMDARYDLLKAADVRQIKDYNEKFLNRRLNPLKGHKYLPFIVVVIDEFADLLVTAGREIEEPIARLAQKARAVGIHLIIATQRPTTDIITGTIKANFNARIAFRVNTSVDSKTIIDAPGANRLIGRGDMLVLAPGEDLERVQCALIDTPEIIELNKCISEQRGYSSPFYLPEYVDESEEGASDASDVDLRKRDKLFEEAAKIVVQYQQGSTSLLQRKLNLGYNRAGRIIDQLESAGIVGPYEGSKARAVLITDFDSLDRKIEALDHATID